MEQGDGLIERARTLLNIDRAAGAEKLVRQYLVKAPNDTEALLLLSHCCCDQDKYPHAIHHAREAIALDPQDDIAFFHLGRALLASDRTHEAVKVIHEAIGLSPQEPRHRALLSRALHILDKQKEAVAAADAGLALAPDDAELLQLRGYGLLSQGKLKEARVAQREALRSDPSSAEGHRLSGLSALHAARYKEARTHFKEALRLNLTSEAAREGMLEVMRATFPPYRLSQWLMLWRTRTPQWKMALIAVVAAVIVNSLDRLGLEQPIEGIVWGVVSLVLLTFAFGFMLSPLADALLLLHPFGRSALGTQEKLEAAVSLAGLVLMAFGTGAIANGGDITFIAWVLWGLVLWMMAAKTRTFEDRRNARLNWRLTVVTMYWGGSGALLLVWERTEVAGWVVFVPLMVGFGIYNWMSGFYMR